jgi:hypothetical protein
MEPSDCQSCKEGTGPRTISDEYSGTYVVDAVRKVTQPRGWRERLCGEGWWPADACAGPRAGGVRLRGGLRAEARGTGDRWCAAAVCSVQASGGAAGVERCCTAV